MKEKKGIFIFLFCFVLFLGSFVIGYDLMKRANKDPLKAEENTNIKDIEIIHEEDRISPNTVIEIEIKYKECNHTITKLAEIDDIIINMTEEEYREYIKENLPNVKILSFSAKEPIGRRKKSSLPKSLYSGRGR